MKVKIKNFFKSSHSILTVYTIFIVGLIIFNHNVINRYKVYEFEGNSEIFVLEGGLIYRGRDINRFNGAFITYLGEEKRVLSYNIGYYLEDGTVISRFINNGADEVQFSLTDVLDMPFTLTESTKKSLIFNDKFEFKKIYFKVDILYEDGTKLEETLDLYLNLISG